MASADNTDDVIGMPHDQTPEVDPPTQAKFFELPQELRDKVYSHVFGSTRLCWGSKRTSVHLFVAVKPAAHSLALLQTCRRIRQEIGDEWIRQVLIGFEDPRTMIDKLNAWPSNITQNIRHLRAICDSVLVSGEENQELCGQLTSILRQVPSLRLDTLTFLVILEDVESHGALHQLLKESCGWKKLYYIVENLDMLSVQSFPASASADEEKFKISRCTKHWQKIIEDRDGAASGPSVAIYRPAAGCKAGDLVTSNIREEWEQSILREEAKYFYEGVYEGAWEEYETGREIMIAVERGHSIDYQHS